MYTRQEKIDLYEKINRICEDKKYEVTLVFNSDVEIEVKVSLLETTLNGNSFSASISYFTNDINNQTKVDIRDIKDVK